MTQARDHQSHIQIYEAKQQFTASIWEANTQNRTQNIMAGTEINENSSGGTSTVVGTAQGHLTEAAAAPVEIVIKKGDLLRLICYDEKVLTVSANRARIAGGGGYVSILHTIYYIYIYRSD